MKSQVLRWSRYVFFCFADKHQSWIFVYFEYRSYFYILLHFGTSLNPSWVLFIYSFYRKIRSVSLKEISQCSNIIAFLLNCNYYMNRDARI